jgi:predicted nucleotidyltransferase component of viral defense system
MKKIAALPVADRRALFNETGVRTGLPPFHVEKDFWVCWTLSTLFRTKAIGPFLTFRGGTSLSKCWGLIDRFSEDIDLSMARAWFSNAKDPGESGISNSERETRLKGLRDECRKIISEVLVPEIQMETAKLPAPLKSKLNHWSGHGIHSVSIFIIQMREWRFLLTIIGQR